VLVGIVSRKANDGGGQGRLQTTILLGHDIAPDPPLHSANAQLVESIHVRRQDEPPVQ
jgi:hypothetical protein